jgi:hypothetical protein
MKTKKTEPSPDEDLNLTAIDRINGTDENPAHIPGVGLSNNEPAKEPAKTVECKPTN